MIAKNRIYFNDDTLKDEESKLISLSIEKLKFEILKKGKEDRKASAFWESK